MNDQRERPAGREYSFFIEISLAGLVVFAVAITIALVTDAPTGSVADWVAAISTLAAFLAAVIAGKFAYDALQVEQARDRFRDEQLTRRQAELVAAWTDEAETTVATTEWRPARTFRIPRLVVRNASSLPVINLRAAITARSYGNDRQRALVIGRIDRPVVPPTVEPEAEPFDEGLLSALRAFRDEEGTDSRIVLTVGVIFTDASGLHWIRNDDGDLRTAPPELVAERERDRPL